jgi:hypothetical protein
MRLEELARLGDEEWDAALVASGRPYRFSHRAAAGRALERAFPSYEFTPCRATYDDGSAALFPLVKVNRKLPSLSMVLGMPLGLEGTPLALEGTLTGEHLRAALGELGGSGFMAVYGGAGSSPPPTGDVASNVTHALDLRYGYDAVWKNSFTAKNRNVCRKAEREGVVVEQADRGASDDYWALYATLTRSWGYDTPPYPRELFQAFMDSGEAELWLARLDGKLVAGALLLCGSNDLLYWSGAMDREHANVAPSNAVLRTVIESACERGIEYVDFGASTDLPGVEAFKRSFGATARDYIAVSWSSRRHRTLEWSRRQVARKGA